MTAILDLSEKVIGKVHTTLTIVNRADQVLVENGFWVSIHKQWSNDRFSGISK